MKNCDDHVTSGDRGTCSPLVTLSLPLVFSKHHGGLHSQYVREQYHRESNETSPKESACASLLFHGEVCHLLLLLFPAEFCISCPSLYDRGRLHLGPPLEEFSLAVHWYYPLDTIVIHRIRPFHAQSFSLAMPSVTGALPVNTDTLHALTANDVSRSRACLSLIGQFYACIHAYATWSGKK